MLLVFDDQGVSEELKKHFLITDICGIFYAVRPFFLTQCIYLLIVFFQAVLLIKDVSMFQGGQDPDVPKKTLPSPENSRLTLQALESRLQVGLLAPVW